MLGSYIYSPPVTTLAIGLIFSIAIYVLLFALGIVKYWLLFVFLAFLYLWHKYKKLENRNIYKLKTKRRSR